MKIQNDHLYRKMATFDFNEKRFVMFMDKTSRMAFLNIDNEGKFHYPELRDVLALTTIFTSEQKGVQNLIFDNKNKKVKKFKFLPKVKIGGTIALLTAAILVGCGANNTPTANIESDPQPGTMAYGYKYGFNSKDTASVSTTDDEEENDETIVIDLGDTQVTLDENSDKYLEYLSPADDEYDYKWANDYEESDVLHFKYARDSKQYSQIFGFSKPTVEDLNQTIDNNSNLSSKYKKFLKQYVSDWLTLWPDSDLSVFKYNLQTLNIEELTDRQIQMKTMSSGAVACYVADENTVYVNENIDISTKANNDYIVLTHELTHAARTCRTKIGEDKVNIRFFEDENFGLYEDEAIVTNLAYQMQNMNNKAVYYTLQSAIYREMLETIDFDGADYMNHSMNYFIEKMQEHFDEIGVETPAYHFVNLVDSQALMHYKSNRDSYEFTDFSEEYDAIVRNYAAAHLHEGMSAEEVNQVYAEFIEDLTYNEENLDNPYTEISSTTFSPYWETVVQEMGLSTTQAITR